MTSATFNSNRFVRLDWKNSSAELAAKVIFKINPSVHSTWQNCLNYIVDLSMNHALNCVANNQYPWMYETGGWCVTFIPSNNSDYSHTVEVTLTPSVVNKYLKIVG